MINLNIAKNRGLDLALYKHLSEVKEASRYELRQKFNTASPALVSYSISSLKHKGYIEEENGVIRFTHIKEEAA
ncbi:MAG: hypothetical protein M0R47_18915 [Methylobacter sp.]|uniref:hypothetical protein n=1 Tax=Methylobacter sp. TaxID=2051955 RepID=UPI0025F5C9CF|nr:hypothetical protein [Methylobacter sp.]MCK9622593.1 hypothetical protein [Methylobacter sp.]